MLLRQNRERDLQAVIARAAAVPAVLKDTPTNRVRAMADKSDAVLDYLSLLETVSSLGEQSRGTYASGIANFARFLLFRHKEDTIPPADPEDLARWFAAIPDPQTRASYLSHLKFACDIARVGIDWSRWSKAYATTGQATRPPPAHHRAERTCR